jgi:hypothetical protein
VAYDLFLPKCRCSTDLHPHQYLWPATQALLEMQEESHPANVDVSLGCAWKASGNMAWKIRTHPMAGGV